MFIISLILNWMLYVLASILVSVPLTVFFHMVHLSYEEGVIAALLLGIAFCEVWETWISPFIKREETKK